MIFYAVRHGQTDWNALGRVCGRTDLPLNAEGERQARQTAGSLRGLAIERIVCSPLLRARQTADFAAQALGLPVRVDARLIEQDYRRPGNQETEHLHFVFHTMGIVL